MLPAALFTCVALAALPLAVSAADLSRATAAADADAASAATPQVPPRTHVPLELLWPAGLGVGYISITLKQQLRRRGHTDPAGRPTYNDLVSLNSVHKPPRPDDGHARHVSPKGRA